MAEQPPAPKAPAAPTNTAAPSAPKPAGPPAQTAKPTSAVPPKAPAASGDGKSPGPKTAPPAAKPVAAQTAQPPSASAAKTEKSPTAPAAVAAPTAKAATTPQKAQVAAASSDGKSPEAKTAPPAAKTVTAQTAQAPSASTVKTEKSPTPPAAAAVSPAKAETTPQKGQATAVPAKAPATTVSSDGKSPEAKTVTAQTAQAPSASAAKTEKSPTPPAAAVASPAKAGTTAQTGQTPAKTPPSSLMKGVFSNQSIIKVGTGTTTRKTIQKTFWFVQENNDGTYAVQMLNAAYVPTGPTKIVSKDELLNSYQPEPEMYQQTVFPRMQTLTKTIARAERHRQRGELFSAEFEFNNALKVDEQNVRANFGLGLTYLERAETDKADDLFKRLVKLDAAFEAEHKHLFNEFGINLRKNKMYKQAVEYYEKASGLSPNDENLLYNMARAYLEEKNLEKASEYVMKSLAKNPDLEPAKKLLQWLKDKGFYKAPAGQDKP